MSDESLLISLEDHSSATGQVSSSRTLSQAVAVAPQHAPSSVGYRGIPLYPSLGEVRTTPSDSAPYLLSLGGHRPPAAKSTVTATRIDVTSVLEALDRLDPEVSQRVSFRDVSLIVRAVFEAHPELESSSERGSAAGVSAPALGGSSTGNYAQAAARPAAPSSGPRGKKNTTVHVVLRPTPSAPPKSPSPKKERSAAAKGGKTPTAAAPKEKGGFPKKESSATTGKGAPKGAPASTVAKEPTKKSEQELGQLRSSVIAKMWRSLQTVIDQTADGKGHTLASGLGVRKDRIEKFVNSQTKDILVGWREAANNQASPLPILELSGFLDLPEFDRCWSASAEIQDYRDNYHRRLELRRRREVAPQGGSKTRFWTKAVCPQLDHKSFVDRLGDLTPVELQGILKLPGLSSKAGRPRFWVESLSPRGPLKDWVKVTVTFDGENVSHLPALPPNYPGLLSPGKFRIYLTLAPGENGNTVLAGALTKQSAESWAGDHSCPIAARETAESQGAAADPSSGPGKDQRSEADGRSVTPINQVKDLVGSVARNVVTSVANAAVSELLGKVGY